MSANWKRIGSDKVSQEVWLWYTVPVNCITLHCQSSKFLKQTGVAKKIKTTTQGLSGQNGTKCVSSCCNRCMQCHNVLYNYVLEPIKISKNKVIHFLKIKMMKSLSKKTANTPLLSNFNILA